MRHPLSRQTTLSFRLTHNRLLYIPIEARHIESITSKFNKAKSTTSEASTKMALSGQSLQGPGFVILNMIRWMNIIGLLAVIAASIVMLVKTSTASKFFFFDAVSHVLTAITGSKWESVHTIIKHNADRLQVFLTVSELPKIPKGYYARNWPLLSEGHGFVTLALAMQVLGINMLGNLNKPATSQKSLGLAFWRIVIGSGIVIFILGFVNFIASYVFRDRNAGVTARQVRSHGATASLHSPKSTGTATPSAPELAQSYISRDTGSPMRTRNPLNLFTSSDRRQSGLPSYSSASPTSNPLPYPNRDPVSPTSRYSRVTACSKKKAFGLFTGRRDSVAPPLPLNTSHTEPEISGVLNPRPIFNRPDSALHPSRTGESETRRWRAN